MLVTSYGYDAGGWLQSVTDPRALVTQTTHDALGRVTQTVENVTSGGITTTNNKTTQFSYDGSNHLLTYKLLLPSGYQETQYVYGFSSSTITSNDLLAEVRHPDKSTGAASTSEKDVYGYNALGEATALYSRNGNYHHYSFDVMGRPTRDSIAPRPEKGSG